MSIIKCMVRTNLRSLSSVVPPAPCPGRHAGVSRDLLEDEEDRRQDGMEGPGQQQHAIGRACESEKLSQCDRDVGSIAQSTWEELSGPGELDPGPARSLQLLDVGPALPPQLTSASATRMASQRTHLADDRARDWVGHQKLGHNLLRARRHLPAGPCEPCEAKSTKTDKGKHFTDRQPMRCIERPPQLHSLPEQ